MGRKRAVAQILWLVSRAVQAKKNIVIELNVRSAIEEVARQPSFSTEVQARLDLLHLDSFNSLEEAVTYLCQNMSFDDLVAATAVSIFNYKESVQIQGGFTHDIAISAEQVVELVHAHAEQA